MRDYCLFAVFGFCLVATLRRPWIGVLTYICLAYLNPGRLCYGPAHFFPFSLICVVVLLFSLLISSEPKRIPLTREAVILISFALWMTLTTYTSLHPEESWAKWSQAIKIDFMVLIVLMMMTTRQRLNDVVRVILLSLAYYGLRGAAGTILTGGNYRVYGPDDTFIADNNDLALTLVSVLPLAIYALSLVKRTASKMGLLVVIGGLAISVIGTYSRAGLLALAAVAIMLCLRSKYRIKSAVLALTFAGAAWLLAPSSWFERMQTIGSYQEDASAMGRVNAWRFAVRLAGTYPITGGGFEAFSPDLFLRFAPEPENYHAAHSIYFKILGEHGYVGLALFVALWVSTWFTANSVRKQADLPQESEWLRDLCGMAQIAMVGYAVGGAFGNQCYFDMPYHLMAIIVGCRLVSRRELKNRPVDIHEPAHFLALRSNVEVLQTSL